MEMTEGKKQAIFLEMLRLLEIEGKCSSRFHDLAEVLFNDRFDESISEDREYREDLV